MNVGEVEEVRFKNKPSDIFWLEVLSKETLCLFFLFVSFICCCLFWFHFLKKVVIEDVEDEKASGHYLKTIAGLCWVSATATWGLLRGFGS